MQTNYADIGGSPEYYPNLNIPDVKNEFTLALDYNKRHSRSPSSERFSNPNARKIDQDLRSTADAESTFIKQSNYQRSEADSLLHSCQIKKAILKEKLTSAEIKLGHLLRAQKIREQIEAATDVPTSYTMAAIDYQAFKRLSAKPESRASSDEEKLLKMKEERVVHNHNLNVLRQKIERLRVTEGQLTRQSIALGKKEASLYSRLNMYERLVRENIALKSKLQKAAIVLSS